MSLNSVRLLIMRKNDENRKVDGWDRQGGKRLIIMDEERKNISIRKKITERVKKDDEMNKNGKTR